MSQQLGRLDYAAFAFQTDFDTPNTTPAAYIPYNTFTIQGMHEPQEVTSTRSNRIADTGSVDGQKRSEGDLAIDLDAIHAGYLFAWFLGNEAYTAGTPNEHRLYPTVSGSTARYATITRDYGGTSAKQFNSVACNTLSLEVSDAIATITANAIGKFPINGTSQTPATVSGTVFNFARFQLQFGSTITAAEAATPTPVENFSMEMNNNLVVVHSSRTSDGANSNDVRLIRLGQLQATGSFTLFFDSVTDLNRYYDLDKTSMVAKFSQGALEDLSIRMSKVSYREQTINTGLEDLFALETSFTVELDLGAAPTEYLDVVINNSKASAYIS